MKNGESPALFAKTLFKRMPKRVKAERRVFVYDNCCNFHKFTLRRYPWRSRRWTFVIDRHHYKNHKLCSSAYNMDSYKWLDGVNSQVCEQRNNQLRKMAKSLAHMTFKNYLRNLTLFFSYTNLKIKKVIDCPKWNWNKNIIVFVFLNLLFRKICHLYMSQDWSKQHNATLTIHNT